MMRQHMFPKILKDWKTADYKRAQEVLWRLHSIIERPDLINTLEAQELNVEVKEIGDAFAEQIHWDRYGCTIGCYTG